VASILSYGFVTYVSHGWQYIQAFGAIPPIIMLLLKDWVPESPKWLLAQDSTGATHQKVIDMFRYLRPENYNSDAEIQVILDESKKDAQVSTATWAEVFKCKKAVVIGVGLMFFQAATGVNSVIFYSSTIFQLAGFSQSIIGTVIVSVVNVFLTLIAAKLIDKAGRKVLILSGTYGM
jgi:MFS family permease